MNYEQILKKYFGYDSFRGIQKDIVQSIGAGHDTLGLMPTGGGKSITFQVPALAMEGVCIVVTPLISLMKDQVMHLRERGILAAFVNSTMVYREIQQTLDNAILGGVKFLYLSPERLSTTLFKTKLKYMKVCFVTVDEAHCISQWGYDFRPSYLQISQIREQIPDVPILALTATATPDVVDDIQRQLAFRKPCVFRMSFKRDNLVYVVRDTMSKFDEIVHILNSVKGSAIVYVRNREITKKLSKDLEDAGFSSAYYHAGVDAAIKEQRQIDWQDDRTRVIVATNAFGMGIDKPDVRIVIHYDCPDSIEAYFQEAGRAGRDGRKSYAVLLRDKNDAQKLMMRVRSGFPPKEYIRKLYDHLAYFFQLAVDSGVGASYEFDISRFCYTFKHFPAHVETSLSILQRAGYLKYEPESDSEPRVMFLVGRDQLYRLREVSVEEDSIITALLRIYGSLFSDLTYIELGALAQMCAMSEEKLEVYLKNLNHRGILKYVPRRSVPRITYTHQRVDGERLHFDKKIYEELLEKAEARVRAVVDYVVSNDECRQSMLLAYFGEKADRCGMCDTCLQNDKRKSEDGAYDMRKMIEEKIKIGELVRVSDLSKLKCDHKKLAEAVNELREEGRLLLDGIKLKWN